MYVGIIFKENNFDRISERELIFAFLSLTKHSDRKANTLIYLWAISDDTIREELKNKIVIDIELFENTEMFQDYQKTQFDLCAHYYSKKEYEKNLVDFYSGKYTYE